LRLLPLPQKCGGLWQATELLREVRFLGHTGFRRCTTSWKVMVSIPDVIIDFVFNLLNPSGVTTAVGFLSASNTSEHQKIFLGVKLGSRKADGLNPICEPIV
jgi:hypothetical protein